MVYYNFRKCLGTRSSYENLVLSFGKNALSRACSFQMARLTNLREEAGVSDKNERYRSVAAVATENVSIVKKKKKSYQRSKIHQGGKGKENAQGFMYLGPPVQCYIIGSLLSVLRGGLQHGCYHFCLKEVRSCLL